MNLAVLSRGPQLYSTRSLVQAGRRRGHRVEVIDHLYCNLLIEGGQPQVFHGDRLLWGVDAVIPRIGASVTVPGAAIIRQFEMMGIFSVTSSEALLRSRDKLQCLQWLSQVGVGLPRTAYSNFTETPRELIDLAGGVPLVIKLLKSTHGLGVILAEKESVAESVIEAFARIRERVIVQEYIAEAGGADLRVLVIDGQVVAAMKRQAQPGEFRSNLHRGATATPVELEPEEAATAIRAAEALGLKVAGVDLLQSDRGPLVLEVNPSPGLEGITSTTGIDIADHIIRYIEKEVI
ncbi:MAG: RimK family alpha-L-glutamate ligase [Bacteroidota bacterium]